SLEQRTEDRLHVAALALVQEQVRDPDVQPVRDRGERLQVRRTLPALDHGQEGDADARALAQILLGHAHGARHPELTNPAPDILDDASLALDHSGEDAGLSLWKETYYQHARHRPDTTSETS